MRMTAAGVSVTRGIVVNAESGPDSTLRLVLPLGPEQAGRELQVIVEPVPMRMTQADWAEWREN